MPPAELVTVIEQLQHSLSAKRRSAARQLRKLGTPEAGPALLAALQSEVEDPRTWETQYQMIMALGHCRHAPATVLLRDLAARKLEATMIYVAIGDALVRLAGATAEMGQVARDLVASRNLELGDGACRALAMLHVVPTRDVIEALLTHAERGSLHESQRSNPRFWVAAACPGWLHETPSVQPFLQRCLASNNQQVRLAAEKALQGKYSRWSPL